MKKLIELGEDCRKRD